MRGDQEGDKLERIHYHLQEASRLEHDLSDEAEGGATVFGKMIYGLQLALESIHGVDE